MDGKTNPAYLPDDKLANSGVTIFTVMSQMAQDHQAINLSQGFPDFHCPESLTAYVSEAMRAGLNQYAPMMGLPTLRAAIADKTLQFYGTRPDPDREITVTSGATEALFVAVQAAVGPGDEVIVMDPAYDSYEPAVTLAGGRTIHVPLLLPDFAIDWQRVHDALTPRTRLLIINSPHNPTGAVLSRADLAVLAGIVEDHSLLLLSDEVYEHMVYDGRRHESLLTHETLAARAFVVSSFGKTYHTTGWKIGYCIAPPLLTGLFRKIHQYVTFCSNTPVQHGLARFLVEHPEHARDLPAFYQQKRDLFHECLAGSRFKLRPAAGTYFQLADYSEISDVDDVQFATWLTQKVGVAAIPISVFCERKPHTSLIRFCFAKNDDTLRAAAQRLSAL